VLRTEQTTEFLFSSSFRFHGCEADQPDPQGAFAVAEVAQPD
jgi:hypothetical protein